MNETDEPMGVNDFTALVKAVSELGISVEEHTRKFIEGLGGDGIEIEDISDIIDTDSGLYDIAPNGDVLRIAIFINQGNANIHQGLGTASWHKFHLYNCSTIKSYPISRKYRYKKTCNAEGRFQYIIVQGNREYNPREREKGRKLHLCKNCKRKLPRRFWRYPVSNFPIGKFFKDKSNKFDPNWDNASFETEYGQNPNVYPSDWREIAGRLKQMRNWTCEQCHINLSSDRRFLHVHHTDGNPSSNALCNLKALCIDCHSKQPLHEHVKKLPGYREFMQKYKNYGVEVTPE